VTTTPAVTTTTTPVTTTTQTTTGTGTSPQVTLPASGHLKPGDTGAEVETLQRALVAIGAGSLTVDGTYGPATQQVVTAFQTANGLTADGIVGAQTAAAINAALAAQG
jgi:peptidoglycan hydrolase-like protein with peptidoglycan-binding domain